MNEVGMMRKSWWRCPRPYIVLCMYAGTFLIWLGFSAALWQYAYLETPIEQAAATADRVRMNWLLLHWTNRWTLAVLAGVFLYAVATILYNRADNARRWKETAAAVRNFFRKDSESR